MDLVIHRSFLSLQRSSVALTTSLQGCVEHCLLTGHSAWYSDEKPIVEQHLINRRE
jgi:hypothetical protein